LTQLREINIKSNLNSISDFLFYNCISLETIKILNSALLSNNTLSFTNLEIVSIGQDPFYNLNITQIIIPDSVSELHSMAFDGCFEVSYLEIQKPFAQFFGISLNNKYRLVHFILDNILIIENGVLGLSELIIDELKDGAFTGTGILESKFPKQCQKIGNSIFKKCRKLERIKIPFILSRIPEKMFCQCSSLQLLIIYN
jgi:hypothetical protein